MKIFLTGGNGFLGSHVTRRLVAEGHEVVALRYPGTPLVECAGSGSIEWIEGTLEDDFSTPLASCSALLHLAAYGVNPAQNDWKECFRWNVTASLNLWLQAAAAGIKRFVIAGSCFEYGLSGERYAAIPVRAPLLPTKPYDASKAAATLAAHALAVDKGLELAILRPFHLFGEGEAPTRFWPSLRKAALAGDDFPMTAGEQVRDFVPVEFAAKRFVEALTDPSIIAGQPVIRNLGTGQPQSLRQFAEAGWKEWGATGKLIFGAVPYRANEVMRYVPEITDSADDS
jgi:nucleoside-diphosphate-sugar epimerase